MMTFTFEEATFLEEQYIKLIEKKAETFLRTLKPNTVYKGIFISINEELGVLSSVEGSFFFSTNTRPVYIAMKLRQAVRAYAARYAAQNPEYWLLSFKEWLTTDDINNGVENAEIIIHKKHERELNDFMADKPEKYEFNIANNIEDYKTWISEIGSIGSCELTSSEGLYIIQQKQIAAGSYKVSVEHSITFETISWVDTWEDREKKTWIRQFKGGMTLYYQGETYLKYELGYKTEFWTFEPKSPEYDNKFGVADIETYSVRGVEGEGLQIPYAAEFKDPKGKYKQFYVQGPVQPSNWTIWLT